jgi:CRISPR system Cascade subunit CasE
MQTTYYLSILRPKSAHASLQITALAGTNHFSQRDLLYKLFDYLPPEEKHHQQPKHRALFIYRADLGEDTPLVHLVSAHPPQDQDDLWELETRPYDPLFPTGETVAFRIRINPTVSRGGEPGQKVRKHDLVTDILKSLSQDGATPPPLAAVVRNAGIQWMEWKLQYLGGDLDLAQLKVHSYHKYYAPQGKGGVLSTLDVEGVITVTNPERFREVLLQGFGPSKAFGCGLMLVERVPG